MKIYNNDWNKLSRKNFWKFSPKSNMVDIINCKRSRESKSTTHNILKRFRERTSRKVTPETITLRRKLWMFSAKIQALCSLRDLRSKYEISHSNVGRLKRKYGSKSHKKIKNPNRDTLKNSCVILIARKLHRLKMTSFLVAYGRRNVFKNWF